MKNPTLIATLSMIGTIIGAGIFGVPYAFARAGVPLGILYMVILGASAILVHGFYARVAAATPGSHRLVGYARRYLGRGGQRIASASSVLGMLGALLAYLILGGTFLHSLFGGTLMFWILVFFFLMAMLLALPFKRIAKVEGMLTWILLWVAVFLIILAGQHVRPELLVQVHPDYWFLPYGIIFFSLGGASVVPDIVDLLKKNVRDSLIATSVGTTTAVLITALFGLAIAGATGNMTSEEAIRGLVPLLGRSIIAVGAAFGLLAVATSFVTIGSNVKEQFEYDFKLSPTLSYSITILAPLIAFFVGARSFIGVIGFVGSIFGVIDGILIVLMARTLPRLPWRWTLAPLIVLFLIGIVAEVLTIIT